MPVQKFRSVEDMARPDRVSEHELGERIAAAWRRAFLLCPPAFTRGLKRFQSIEEANADRERATADRMRRLAGARPG